MIEDIHECTICRGRFSDEELLHTHVCPLREGNEFIEIEAAPPESDRLGIVTEENATGLCAVMRISGPLLRELLELPEDCEIVGDDDIGNVLLKVRGPRFPQSAAEVLPTWRKLGDNKAEFVEFQVVR